MGIRSVTLLFALGVHFVVLSLTMPGDMLQAPRISGKQSIEIQLSTVEKKEAKKQEIVPKKEITPVLDKKECSPEPPPITRLEPKARKRVKVPKVIAERSEPQEPDKPQERPVEVAESVPSVVDKAETAVAGGEQAQAGVEKPAVVKAVPEYSQNERPLYPAIARRRNWQGRVVLEVLVAADGSAETVSILHGSGYSMLDKAALKAVRRWTFVSGRIAGKRVDMRILVPVLFQLTGH